MLRYSNPDSAGLFNVAWVRGAQCYDWVSHFKGSSKNISGLTLQEGASGIDIE